MKRVVARGPGRAGADLALRTYGMLKSLRYDTRKTVVVASSGRGGSTWLAEVLSTLPRSQVIYEPLQPNMDRDAVRWGFPWNACIPPGARDPHKLEYFRRLFAGRTLSVPMARRFKFNARDLVLCNRYIVKFIGANLLLRWVLDQLTVNAILLLRHPCAVVASQLASPWWEAVQDKDSLGVHSALFVHYPHLAPIFDRITQREEAMAFLVAVQQVLPLSSPRPHPWLLTTYERLILDGPLELERIFGYLGEKTPEKAIRQLEIPSKSTTPGTPVASTDHASRITKWREQLTSKQIDNILSTIDAVGVTWYSDAPLPDESQLPVTDLKSEALSL